MLKDLVTPVLHVLLPKTQMWHRSMTNVRPLRLVIVCSTGADYGSLHAPYCVCVTVWVEGERHRERQTEHNL